MGSTKRLLGLLGLLVIILIVPASPAMGQAADRLAACADIAFSTEEDFITDSVDPWDGNHLISDGDLLGTNCVVCRRNRELLEVFEVTEDLGLDAADVINVDTGLVAFSTELDHPRGAFKAGDLLTTHGVVIPNFALLYPFDLPRRVDLGLDAVHFVGDLRGINAFLDYAADVGREQWLREPSMLSALLEEYGINILFSTEGTPPWPEDAPFLDGDLLSVLGGAIALRNDTLLPTSVPAGIPRRGVDFGLDAVTTDRSGTVELFHFSTEILFNGDPAFTDGDVLRFGNGVTDANLDLTRCWEPKADELGLDALYFSMAQVEPQATGDRGTVSLAASATSSRPEGLAASTPSDEQAVTPTSNNQDTTNAVCDLFPFACTTLDDAELDGTNPYHVEQSPMAACRERAFSTEEEFVTYAPEPPDGNPIISDGDLLGPDCEICARNRELLTPFKVEVDLGLDAADVIDVDTELVAFSTELDDPNGQFTAGDLLATNGAAIPNQALLWGFKVDYDIGLDAVYFVGPKDAVVDLLSYAARLTREEWLADPQRLAEMLEEAGLDLWFSTEGTPPPLENPQFLDGDLLSVVSGTVVEQHYDLLPSDVPAGWIVRGVDFGLDAISGDHGDRVRPLRFSTEILYRGERSFTDGDVLVHGDWIESTNPDLLSPCSPMADFLGLDAYSFAPPCEPSIEVEKQVLKEAEVVVEPVDIMFAFDATGSMGDEIDEVKESAAHIMSNIRAVIADSQFGLASFADYPQDYTDYCGYSNQYGWPSVPDWPYRLDQALTTDIAAVQGAIGSLALGNGADLPEDYARALWELGVNDVANVGWRADATKIVIMFGDAPTHDCDFYATSYGGDPGPDGVADNTDDLDFESVVAQLAAKDVIVLSVDSSNTPGGDPEKSFKYMAYQTGGAYYRLSDAQDIPRAVEELVTSVFGTWVDQITSIISDTVRFRATIHNNGTCCPLSHIVTTDLLPPSLEYRDNATVNGVPWEPERIDDKTFRWDLGDWVLNPSQTVEIEFDAHVTECGEDVNNQVVEAIGCDQAVSASDTAAVFVPCEPSIEVEKQVLKEAEEVVTPVDVVFTFDATGSMGDEIDEVKSSATNIMNDIRAVIANSRFGLASFADYPDTYFDYCGYSAEYGDPTVPDWPYRLDQALTTNIPTVQGAISALTLGHGRDLPEDYSRALWELGVNDAADVGWRADATKIVIIFGDAPVHDCDFYASSHGGDPGPDGVAGTTDDLNFESVVAQLAANDVIVLSVDSSNNPGGDAEKSFKYMAYRTGGAYYPLSDAVDIPGAVKELVTSVFGTWVDEITTVVSDTVRFRCTIHNNGTGCPLSQIVASDLLPPSLEYRDNATVNGAPWEPAEVAPKEFVWDLGRWVLNPSETIEIEFDAHVTECGTDINTQAVEAVGCDQAVSASDTATVLVPCVEKPEIYIEPAMVTTSVSGTVTVDIMIRNIEDLYGAQVELSFDPTLVEVVDAYDFIPGVQIEEGNFPVPDQVSLNTANNTNGTIQYAVSLQGDKPGVSGTGRLARITFHGRGEGTSAVAFTQSVLSDPGSVAIEHTTKGGFVDVLESQGIVSGRVVLERRASNAGTDVCLNGTCAVTPEDGSYTFYGVTPGPYNLAVSHMSYLRSSRALSVPVGALTVPDVTLLGGDVNQDGRIDLTDGNLIGQAWNTVPGDPKWDKRADVTDDDTINILDMVAVQFNWDQTAPGPWAAAHATRLVAPDWAVPADKTAETKVVIAPSLAELTAISETVELDIEVQDVTDLWAARVQISFDPTVIRAQDTDPRPSAPGVQIIPGDFLDPAFQTVLVNQVDNAAGTIDFAVTETNPAEPQDGTGVLATIRFEAVGNGTSPVHLDSIQLEDDSNPEPMPIPADAEHGKVVVGEQRIYLPLVLRGG